MTSQFLYIGVFTVGGTSPYTVTVIAQNVKEAEEKLRTAMSVGNLISKFEVHTFQELMEATYVRTS